MSANKKPECDRNGCIECLTSSPDRERQYEIVNPLNGETIPVSAGTLIAELRSQLAAQLPPESVSVSEPENAPLSPNIEACINTLIVFVEDGWPESHRQGALRSLRRTIREEYQK